VLKGAKKFRSGEQVAKDRLQQDLDKWRWETYNLPKDQREHPKAAFLRILNEQPNITYGDKRPDTHLPTPRKRK
jgi:hypothetical protein